MLVHTRSIGFDLTEAIRNYAESRVRAALFPFLRKVAYVVVKLEDVNAHRGGYDKKCRIVVSFRRGGMVIVQAMEPDLYAAIDVARDRLRRAAMRELCRRPARERRVALAVTAPLAV